MKNVGGVIIGSNWDFCVNVFWEPDFWTFWLSDLINVHIYIYWSCVVTHYLYLSSLTLGRMCPFHEKSNKEKSKCTTSYSYPPPHTGLRDLLGVWGDYNTTGSGVECRFFGTRNMKHTPHFGTSTYLAATSVQIMNLTFLSLKDCRFAFLSLGARSPWRHTHENSFSFCRFLRYLQKWTDDIMYQVMAWSGNYPIEMDIHWW